MKIKRHRRVTPIYRESGYARRINPVSTAEKWIRIAAVPVLLLTLLVIFIARGDSRWVELYYSRGLYQAIAGVVSLLTGWVPFSLAEWVIIIFSVGCLAAVVHFVAQLVRFRRQTGAVLGRFALRAVSVVSALLLLFTLLGGLNYYRYPFTQYSGLELRPTEVQQLELLCVELAAQADELRVGLAEDAGGVSRYTDGSAWELGKKANESYVAMSAGNEEWAELFRLAGRVRPKPVFFSQAMSYMQVVGVFCPYTIEANINVHTTAYGIPGAMCHELAHVSGFMREDEANFIAYLACRSSADAFFRYSGVMLALVHSTNAFYSYDAQGCSDIMNALSEGVRRDLIANAAYLEHYDTRFGDFATSVNDGYLKANNQADGVASYGRMVDLLLADYRARHGIT